MPIHLYRNKIDEYVFDNDGARLTTCVLLLKARTKRSFGACITSTPLCVWISYPRQVSGFASEDGRADIHISGFDQGPFAWDDYAGDFYELFALDMDLMNKIRSIISDLDFELVIDWFVKLQDLVQHINWSANSSFISPPSEECLTVNDTAWIYLQKISELLTKYISRIHSGIFSYEDAQPA